MSEVHELHGACACDRFQYDILIPSTSHASQAHVFFDNSAASRRAQATPITAWLRIPFAWYQSVIQPFDSYERPGQIRRFFHCVPAREVGLPPMRHFCGFCGTHITAWNEETREHDFADITLGSLGDESLEMLRRLGVYGDEDESEDEEHEVKDDRAQVDNDTHIPLTSRTNTTASNNSAGAHEDNDGHIAPSSSSRTTRSQAHTMHGRGIPYFEDMVENSRLSRIKRWKGGRTSRNGTTIVEWEIMEIGDDEGDGDLTDQDAGPDEPQVKRQRTAV